MAATYAGPWTAALAAGRRISGVCVDLSGTLHVDNMVLGNAVDAVRRLHDSGLKIRFVTNTTKESRRVLYNRLVGLGFPISENQITTSLSTTRQVIEQLSLRPMLLVDPKAKEEFQGIDTSDPNAVVVGLSPQDFCHEVLTGAFRLLMDKPGSPLIAVHKGRYYERGDGLALGPGPFVAALEYATGRTAMVVGKPDKGFFELALAEMGAPASETVMIGDDLRDDVGGAMAAGMFGVCVRTGKFRPADEEQILAAAGTDRPLAHFLADDVSHAVDVILAAVAAQQGRGPA